MRDSCEKNGASAQDAPPGATTSGSMTRPMDGRDLAAMVGAANELLEAHCHIVNALNVFPVPDGDTGTNMSLTLRAVAESASLAAQDDSSSGTVARVMARRALMEARGNSGVILSQFFRGMSEGFDGLENYGTDDLARAIEAATVRSYGAVGEPVEGTMLTVIAAAAREARSAATNGLGLSEALDAISRRAGETVAATQGMLPVLAEAGVVDAGGYGVQLILKGMALYVADEPVTGVKVPVPGGAVVDSSVALRQTFLDQADHGGFGFCTQLLVSTGSAIGPGPDLDDLRRRLGDMASSVVVVGDEGLVKIHVHTDEPDPVIAFAGTLGEIIDRGVQDMDAQEMEFSGAHRTGVRPTGNVSLIAVAAGEGLAALFTDLGAFEVVAGGRTSNPSVKEIAEAIERAPTAAVIVLPNDGNAVPAAEQAAQIWGNSGSSGKSVGVVPTKSIQQGVAAALSLNVEGDLESNLTSMMSAVSSVKSAEVTVSIRDVTLDGLSAVAGEFIGLLDGQLVASSTSPSDVAEAVLTAAGVARDDLVTIFWGEPINREAAEAELTRLTARFEGVEFELVDGGQPHYHYLLSIE